MDPRTLSPPRQISVADAGARLQKALARELSGRHPYWYGTCAKSAKLITRGLKEFYHGDFSENSCDALNKIDGFLTINDFSDHKSEWIEPISISYRGYEVWGFPQNIAMLQMLNILEGFNVREFEYGTEAYCHLFIEAKKLAFDDQSFLDSPGYVA